MWRIAYSIALTFALPFILLRLWWRGKANPAYRSRVSERLGLYSLKPGPKRLWVHAVSVGEVNVATPLIKEILKRWPEYEIVVTTITPTGADQVLKQLNNQVIHRYIPYDIPCLVNRAIDQVEPDALIVMETEIWPNLIHAMHKKGIPVIYLNMRLSDKSFPGYQKIHRLIAPQLAKVGAIAAQTDEDAKRVVALGADADAVNVFGSIKFDVVLPEGVFERGQKLREKIGASRKVWIAASTHKGEDEQVLVAHSAVLENFPNALLILVPRHPERFDDVFRLAERQFKTSRRTESPVDIGDQQVFIGDTMGELFDFYIASDVCFVGGSLVPHGGQNILEPWLVGKPVIVGPHTFNFARTIEQALEVQALIQIDSAHQLAESVKQLFESQSLSEAQVKNAQQLLEKNKGALDKSIRLLESFFG